VSSAEQLEQSISSYVAQGFAVMNRTPNSATMFKKKEFSVLWAVVGLVLCISSSTYLPHCLRRPERPDGGNSRLSTAGRATPAEREGVAGRKVLVGWLTVGGNSGG
jgi:hypothetical protein